MLCKEWTNILLTETINSLYDLGTFPSVDCVLGYLGGAIWKQPTPPSLS